jgi:hypothetical protein
MSGIQIQISAEELKKRKLFLATPMYGGQCVSAQTPIETEDGVKTIKEIVDTRYNGKVKSYSPELGFHFSPVIGWHCRPNTDKKWISLAFNENGKSAQTIVVTDDHECSFVADVFSPVIEYKPAKELPSNYIVREASETTTTNPLFNREQLSVVVGTLLGDSNITKGNALKFMHGHTQVEYAEYKASILNGKISDSYQTSGYAVNKMMKVVYVGANAQTKALAAEFYDSNRKRRITPKMLGMIDPISLAFWYMDDGYCVHDNRNSTWKPFVALCTDAFAVDDVNLLVEKMQSMGIDCKYFDYKGYPRIKILDHAAFFEQIAPYVHSSMEYKVPETYRSIQKHTINNTRQSFGLALVEGIRPYGKYSKLYDITVQDTHNFVANGFLIHNCAGMYTKSLADLSALCVHYGIQLQMYFLFNESLIQRARNYCADEFMRSEATHFMFIDADIGFDPRDVVAMLAMMSDESEYDVLTGPYPKKAISWEKIKQAVDKGFADENPQNLDRFVGDYVFNPKRGQREIPLREPVEVLEAGTGFMMIRRKTFEKYREAYPELLYRPDHARSEHFDGSREIMAYFDCIVDRGYSLDDMHKLLDLSKDGNHDKAKELALKMVSARSDASKRYLSEDYNFCYHVQKAGMKVWFCPWMRLQHVGSFIFGGSLADIAALGASATADGELLQKFRKKSKEKK